MSEDRAALAFQKIFNDVLDSVEQVVIGKTDQVAMALTCLFAEGHVLLEDDPGTGKTTLAKALSQSIGGEMGRVQFTPDLLPADVTGGQIYNQKTQEFEPRLGPVFANVVLADEINRASPKTQSAMLEVMEERQVTLGTSSLPVPRPFVVIATQNPIEQAGTYRLPEAQLDRFLMRLKLGYPARTHMVDVLRGRSAGALADGLEPVTSMSMMQQMIEWVQSIEVRETIDEYIVDIVEATRPGRLSAVELGASPRGAIGIRRAAQVRAASEGRNFVDVQEVKQVAAPVLAHRLILTAEAESRGIRAEDLIEEVVAEVPLPAAIQMR